MPPKEAAHKTMEEVSTALIAIALTLCAVFIPAAFISGISGLFFTQFAVTISASTIISVIVSLTLSPALCAVLLRPHEAHAQPRGIGRLLKVGFGYFNRAFEWLSTNYGKMTARFVRATAVIGVIYLGLIALTGFQMSRLPTGFIPDQDIGYQAVVVILPPGSSLQRTDEVASHLAVTDTTDTNGRVQVRVVRGVVAGQTWVRATATDLGLADSVSYTVLPGAVRQLILGPGDTAVYVGNTVGLRARTYDSWGNERSGDVAQWSVGSGVVAGTRPGVFRGVTIGRTTVHAQLGPLQDSVQLSVVPRGTIAAIYEPVSVGSPFFVASVAASRRGDRRAR